MSNSIKYFILSSVLHFGFFYLLFLSGNIESHLYMPFNDKEDSSYLLKGGESEIKQFLQIEAQAVSQSELDNQIALLKSAKQEQVKARELERAEHEKSLHKLKQERESLLAKKDNIASQIDKLENEKTKQSQELVNLTNEVDLMAQENDKQRQEQNKLKRQQSFAQSVLKESLYSDGSILRSYRQNLGAHIGSHWKKNQLSTLSEASKCVLEISMLPTRRIENITIKESSGNDFFDSNAIAAVKRAEPFPEMNKLAQDKLPKTILVVFNQDSCDIVESRG